VYLSKNFAQVVIIGALSSICLAPGGSRPPGNSGQPSTGVLVPPPFGGRPPVGTGTIIYTPPPVGGVSAPSTGLQPPSSSSMGPGIGFSRPHIPGGTVVLTPPAGGGGGGVIRPPAAATPVATPSPTPRPCAAVTVTHFADFEECVAIGDLCGIRYTCQSGCVVANYNSAVKLLESTCETVRKCRELVPVPQCVRRP